MKRIITLTTCIATIIIFSIGCKKGKTDQGCIDLSNSLTGSWELRRTTAAMSPAPTDYAAGNGNILKFANGNFEKYSNGLLVSSGQFTVVADPSVEQSICLVYPAGEFTNRIVYNNDNAAPKEFLQISNGTLVFVSGCYAVDGGHTSEYERQ